MTARTTACLRRDRAAIRPWIPVHCSGTVAFRTLIHSNTPEAFARLFDPEMSLIPNIQARSNASSETSRQSYVHGRDDYSRCRADVNTRAAAALGRWHFTWCQASWMTARRRSGANLQTLSDANMNSGASARQIHLIKCTS